jgi:hypothetical protein
MKAKVTGGFWRARLDVNARTAIFHQWEQLERSGCIDNFRIAAGQKEGFREGYFFADSDAYKWLDAASRILAEEPDPRLEELVDDFIALLEAAQEPDGYLYTYNQIHFPDRRWVNLQIEHEFYCLGHLIEAGIAHHETTGGTRLLDLVRRTADLLVRDLMDAAPDLTDGHEEIEIALLRLYRHTGEEAYLELARRLLERRGRIPLFPVHLFGQYRSHLRREARVEAERAAYVEAHPEHAGFALPAGNLIKKPPWADLRRVISQLSGRYFQQHLPVRRQTTPVGHSVRFGYLETAAAMLARETEDASLQAPLERAWEQMTERRMYVTGGLGSLPFIEGFGRDYELDPELAYAETCAALAALFWNDEMARLTHNPRYADLFEWQLYNAAAVGMGIEGRSYFYNNPLTCRNDLARADWYLIPCCPSNLSRTWASLGDYVLEVDGQDLWINQYISSEHPWEGGRISIESALPWEGSVRLLLDPPSQVRATLHLRIPSWAPSYTLSLNGANVQPDSTTKTDSLRSTACDYNPSAARSVALDRVWQPGDALALTLQLPIRLLRQDRRLPRCGGMVAVTRGPLVYCLESIDNPDVDIFDVTLDPVSLKAAYDEALLGGAVRITGSSRAGQPLSFIPYFLWGNRGPTAMTVFVRD